MNAVLGPKVHIDQGQEQSKGASLDKYLQQFEFTAPLPKKNEQTTIRIFCNNCNGLEINNAIGEYLGAKREKATQTCIREIDTITKIDKLIRYMKQWKVDISCLAEVWMDWMETSPKIVVQALTKRYDQQACWTV